VTRWRQLGSCDWLWQSHRNLLPGKFDLKINPWKRRDRTIVELNAPTHRLQLILKTVTRNNKQWFNWNNKMQQPKKPLKKSTHAKKKNEKSHTHWSVTQCLLTIINTKHKHTRFVYLELQSIALLWCVFIVLTYSFSEMLYVGRNPYLSKVTLLPF